MTLSIVNFGSVEVLYLQNLTGAKKSHLISCWYGDAGCVVLLGEQMSSKNTHMIVRTQDSHSNIVL